VGTFLFVLGFAYVAGITLDYGLPGVYAGIVLSYACWAVVAVAGFAWGDWADTAAEMMARRDRAAESANDDETDAAESTPQD